MVAGGLGVGGWGVTVIFHAGLIAFLRAVPREVEEENVALLRFCHQPLTPAIGLCYQSYHYRFHQLGPDNSCYRTYQSRADKRLCPEK